MVEIPAAAVMAEHLARDLGGYCACPGYGHRWPSVASGPCCQKKRLQCGVYVLRK